MDFAKSFYELIPSLGNNFALSMIFFVFMLGVGFLMLIKGADFFVESASKIAVKMKIPPIVIGLTIVAFGTSAPEAAVSINSALKGTAGIAVGNVLGSNIFNILFVLGVTSLFAALPIKKPTLQKEMPFVIFISVILLVLGINGAIDFYDGIILAVLFALFFVYLIWTSKSGEIVSTDEMKPLTERDKTPLLAVVLLFALAMIVLGSDFAVFGASKIASVIGISDRVIGLTIVALGTSLPELVTSVLASLKGQRDIALGNVIGSNIFNILFVLGVSSLVAPGGIEFASQFIFDAIVSIAVSVLLLLLVIKSKKLTRSGGVLMLMVYVAYTAYILIFD